MLHPYITASRTMVNILLSKVEIRHWIDTKRPVASLGKWDCFSILIENPSEEVDDDNDYE